MAFDLSTAPIRPLAALVISGRYQLGEIPTARRGAVAKAVEEIRAQQAAKEKKTEVPEIDFTSLKKIELQLKAVELGIEFEPFETKAELIAKIEEKQNARNK